MSADLIPFATHQLSGKSFNTVNARDLYGYLGIAKPYADWIKTQIRRAHLVENRDYVVFHQEVKNPLGGRPASEHHLPFDAAKHVAMMSSAEKGHEVREWFIQKEKELATIQNDPATLLSLYPELRAIAELAVSTAQARSVADLAKAEAQEAKIEAAQANANAHRALETQVFFTVAEYVYVERLTPKIQKSDDKSLSDALQSYCMAKAVPFRRIPVGGKPWEDEYGFHENVYTEVVPGWLKHRYAQTNLIPLHKE